MCQSWIRVESELKVKINLRAAQIPVNSDSSETDMQRQSHYIQAVFFPE